MTRQKTTQPKFLVKVGAAAFAVALPLCAGCVKQTTMPPASQPSGYTEMKRTEPKRMATAMGIAYFEKNKKSATTQPASAPRDGDIIDWAIIEAARASASRPAEVRPKAVFKPIILKRGELNELKPIKIKLKPFSMHGK